MATEDKIDTKSLEEEENIEEKDIDFEYFRSLREKYNIRIDKQQSVTFLEYVTSLDLDPGVFSIFQRKKTTLGSYVHYFDIEMVNGAVEKSTLKWTIRRRFADIVKFDKELNEELTGLNVPKEQIPQLSSFYDTKSESSHEQFLEAAETYLRTLMSTPEVREKSTLLYEFIELSLLPLPNGPRKFKEGYLRKKGGGRFKKNKLRIYASALFTRWQERWFILTEEGILYTVDSNSTRSREMLLFDQSFQLEYGRKATGSHTGISLVTPNRRLNLQANDSFEALDWIGEIQKAARASPYTKINRYLSFAPQREATHYCKWYVDGDGYFSDLYEALILAKREVFITDWWLTPELQLKRPVQEGDTEYRLDKVLGKIARSGVKVYVIVYHEVKMMMYNDSEHVRNALQAESPNVTVLKHPSEPFFSWSHHEKLVVIDQAIGFIGGLDLCFGRYDTNDHPITDPAMTEKKGETYPGQDFANPRLADFRNVREQPDKALIEKTMVPRMPFHDAMVKVIGPVIADMSRHFIQYWNHVGVDVYGKAEQMPLPKNNLVPPPDDVTVKKENATIKLRSAFRKIVGMRRLAEAFGTPIQSLNSVDSNPKEQDSGEKFTEQRPDSETKPHEEKKEPEEAEEPKEKTKPVLVRRETGIDESLKELARKAGGKSEAETEASNEDASASKESKGILGTIVDKSKSIVGQIKDMMPGLPSIPLLTGKKAGEQETGTNILEEDEEAQEKSKYSALLKSIKKKEKEYIDEQMKSDKPNPHRYHHVKATVQGEEKIKTQVTDQFYEKSMLQLLFSPKEKLMEGTVACQMVRSASKWSLGLNSDDGSVENSIQNAYIEIIQNSKRFIYIENQFFMSGTAGKELKNEVAQALLYRIEKAHAKKERFRVLVFLPLLPAFEGEIIDSKAALLKVQVYWQYMTICRSEESIYSVLRKKGITPEDYIQFYSLRQHGKMDNGDPASEMIYIHSKILIADDDIVLIGSANINDRSLQGSRDSEIAMVFEDSKKVPSVMNGKEVQVSEFALSFRKRILAEHTGLSEDEVQDPISVDFTKILNERAETNTNIYREIFACYPDDNMKTLKDIEEFSEKKNLSKYDELAPKIKGHVVWFPLSFLCDDQLTPSMGTVEYYIPDQTFV